MNRKHGLENDNGDTATSKRKFSDLKRLEAVKSRHTESLQRQATIKQALSKSVVDAKTVNSKIIFSEELSKGDELFPEDDDGDIGFNVAPQYEGKKGHKLLKLQSHFGNDNRFNLDARFAESSDDDENDQSQESDQGKPENEYQTNMNALNQVLYVAKTPSEKQKLFRDPGTLRYDPTKTDAYKFKRVTEEKKEKQAEVPEQEPEPEVSSERFYQVSQNLQEALTQQSGESFSLLKSFSSRPQLENEDVEDEPEESPTAKKGQLSKSTVPKTVNDDSRGGNKTKPRHPQAFAGSRFFIYPGDYRLKEGVNFFCRQGDMENVRESWQKGRETVQKIFQLKNRRADSKRWKKQRRRK